MPIVIQSKGGGLGYASPFVGPIHQVKHVKVDISGLTTKEVDADGLLKPGVPLKEVANLAILPGAAAAPIFMTIEPTRLPLVTVPPTDATLATETGDCLVAVAVSGIVNRDVVEDILDRALTANELASFTTAGTLLALTTT